jgi:hypothetical protein
MFSRTACFVAASVFAATGPAAAQVRQPQQPKELQPLQRKDRRSRQHQFRRARYRRRPSSRRPRSQILSAALRAKIDLGKAHQRTPQRYQHRAAAGAAREGDRIIKR